MNQMEKDIITDDFRRIHDCVYNRCNGGNDGPNSAYQKEMHALGLWKQINTGKSAYHDKNGKVKYFFENDVP